MTSFACTYCGFISDRQLHIHSICCESKLIHRLVSVASSPESETHANDIHWLRKSDAELNQEFSAMIGFSQRNKKTMKIAQKRYSELRQLLNTGDQLVWENRNLSYIVFKIKNKCWYNTENTSRIAYINVQIISGVETRGLFVNEIRDASCGSESYATYVSNKRVITRHQNRVRNAQLARFHENDHAYYVRLNRTLQNTVQRNVGREFIEINDDDDDDDLGTMSMNVPEVPISLLSELDDDADDADDYLGTMPMNVPEVPISLLSELDEVGILARSLLSEFNAVEKKTLETKEKAVESTECSICFETLGETNKMILRCGHQFCGDCIFRHYSCPNGSSCPSCRSQFVQCSY